MYRQRQNTGGRQRRGGQKINYSSDWTTKKKRKKETSPWTFSSAWCNYRVKGGGGGREEETEYKGIRNRLNIKRARTEARKPEDTERKAGVWRRDESERGLRVEERLRGPGGGVLEGSQSEESPETHHLQTNRDDQKKITLPFCLTLTRNAVQTSFPVSHTHTHKPCECTAAFQPSRSEFRLQHSVAQRCLLIGRETLIDIQWFGCTADIGADVVLIQCRFHSNSYGFENSAKLIFSFCSWEIGNVGQFRWLWYKQKK